MLASLVSELKQTGEPEEEKGFFASIFKKSTGKLEALKARYEKAEGKLMRLLISSQSIRYSLFRMLQCLIRCIS